MCFQNGAPVSKEKKREDNDDWKENPDYLEEETDPEVEHETAQPTITLNDGVEIPQLGFGTFSVMHSLRKANETAAFKKALLCAIRAGYRHIDSAEFYRTHKVIGQALRELIKHGEVAREDVFITSKVDNSVRTAAAVRRSVARTLSDLQTEYVDLYLIHSPKTKYSKSSGVRGTVFIGCSACF